MIVDAAKTSAYSSAKRKKRGTSRDSTDVMKSRPT